MLLTDTLKLIKTAEVISNEGLYITKELPPKEVSCKRLSVKRDEFYKSMQAGIKPCIAFKMFYFDYEGEQFIRYKDDILNKDQLYKVIRVYSVDKRMIELTCEIAKDGVING